MEKENIKKYSAQELHKMIGDGQYVPISQDSPEFDIDPCVWDDAKIVLPKAKKSVHLRLDEHIVEWFRDQGAGHITRMQAVLKSYYETHS